MIGHNTPVHFIPSSSALLAMIASAEHKFEQDREQAALKKETQAERRMERAITAEVKARHYARVWGAV